MGDFNGRCGNCIETVDEINPNLFGQEIIKLCKSRKLKLLNGSAHYNNRFTFANHIGRSIVDYAITDKKTFKETKFEVLDSNEFSDHSPIRTTFSLVDDILADKRGCLKSDKYDGNEFRVNVVQCPKCNRHRIPTEPSCTEIYHRLKTALENYNHDTQDRRHWLELKKATKEYNKKKSHN
ncbi:hypothetical protein SNE40_021804 [Patella caerulea]|uniref:Uncharacterized protein n=1 Tax=Patella caerulea TaxID=87958 RepID=A0AAN8G8N9_PATCE